VDTELTLRNTLIDIPNDFRVLFPSIRYSALTAVLLLAACGDGGTGPEINVTGTYIGNYTATSDPGVTYEGVLQLTQSGSQVTGTLATNSGRSANISGSISGSRITATFTYTDGCAGSASTTIDISNSGTQLSGTYTATDCTGTYAGGYSLTKQ
jgi:hypothetical protein